MKPIKTVEYIELDATTGQVECRVTYIDDTQEVFFEDDDLQMIQMQLQKQLESGVDG